MNDEHLERILFGPTADPQVGKHLDLQTLAKQTAAVHMEIYRVAYHVGYQAGLDKALELLNKHSPERH